MTSYYLNNYYRSYIYICVCKRTGFFPFPSLILMVLASQKRRSLESSMVQKTLEGTKSLDQREKWSSPKPEKERLNEESCRHIYIYI